MKVNGAYIKILRNLSLYKSELCYEGDRVIRLTKDRVFFVEATVPDFLDVPIYTRNISELLRLMNDETSITVDNNEKGYYIIIDNGIGKVRYKMAKKSSAEKLADLSKNSIDDIFNRCEQKVIKFNLSKDKYDELMKISKMLETNRLCVQSLNENTIRITTYSYENKDDKQYFIDVDVAHTHFDNKLICQLSLMDYVQATDYTFEIGTKIPKNNNGVVPVFKVTAYLDDKINVKYLSVGERENR